jgi:hypothetical protein
MGSLIVDSCLVVAEDPLVEALQLAAKLSYGPRCQMAQVTQGEPGVLA